MQSIKRADPHYPAYPANPARRESIRPVLAKQMRPALIGHRRLSSLT